MRTICILLILICALTATASAEDSPFAYEREGPRLHAGAGAAFLFAFGHTELRYYPKPWLSADAFVSAGYGRLELDLFGTTTRTDFILANAGIESRAHLYPARFIDLHVGVAVSALTLITDGIAAVPLLYVVSGVTFAIGERVRVDMEVDPLLDPSPDAQNRFALLPVLRVRFVF